MKNNSRQSYLVDYLLHIKDKLSQIEFTTIRSRLSLHILVVKASDYFVHNLYRNIDQENLLFDKFAHHPRAQN